jgi:hypothetical protein
LVRLDLGFAEHVLDGKYLGFYHAESRASDESVRKRLATCRNGQVAPGGAGASQPEK